MTGLVIRPADEVAWETLAAVFGTRGESSRCWCQRYKLAPRETFAAVPPEVRADRLRGEADGGLVALDAASGEAVGWCAVEPRPRLTGMRRVGVVPWAGREEDRDDGGVWAISCVLVRAGHRRHGIGSELAVAAVEHARRRGARAVEAYPITTTAVIDQELHVGTVGMFARAGLVEVSHPTPRRLVMRLELA